MMKNEKKYCGTTTKDLAFVSLSLGKRRERVQD